MKKYPWLLVCVFLAGGCAHMSGSDIAKTSDTAFNGLWRGEISGTARYQAVGSWEFECGEFEATVLAQVQEGNLTGYLEQNETLVFQPT